MSRDFQYAVFVATRPDLQRNRNVAGSPVRGVVLRRDIIRR